MSLAGKKQPKYVLGTEDAEIRRLEAQNRVWMDDSKMLWEKSGFRSGMKILDLGCGPGFASVELAKRVGKSGKIMGVDQSEKFISYLKENAKRQNLEQLNGKVSTLAEISRETIGSGYDGAYTRWVFSYIQDLGESVNAVKTVLKSGALWAVTDYFAYRDHFLMVPRTDAWDRMIRAKAESVEAEGGSFDVGQKLPQVFASAGFEVLDLEVRSRTARPADPLWKWPEEFMKIYIPVLMERGLVTKEDSRLYWQDWEDRTKNPTAFFVTPRMIHMVLRKK